MKIPHWTPRLILPMIALLGVVCFAPAEEIIGRLKYGGGGDWYANPTSLPNLLEFARAHTTLDLPRREQVVEIGKIVRIIFGLLSRGIVEQNVHSERFRFSRNQFADIAYTDNTDGLTVKAEIMVICYRQ